MSSHRLRAYIYLLIVAAIWGAAGPVIKFTLGGIDPFPFLAYRFAISAFLSLIFFSISGLKLPKAKTSLIFVLLYGLFAIPIALGALFTGLDKSTVLDLTLIGAVGPLVVTAGGAMLFRDHVTHREKIGIAIVLIGVFLNAFYPILTNNSDTRLTGNIFLLLFLLADSSAILIAKKAVKEKVKSATLTNFAFIIGAFTIIPFTFLTHGFASTITSIATLPFKYHLGVWYMALLSGTLAYFLYVRGQRSIEVSEAVLFNYLQPIFSIPLALFWLNETLTPSFLMGAALIVAGLVIAEYKKRKYNSK
jgi:drug/metabolite transporter (DMT)-like permease